MPTIYGYARCSTNETSQDIQRQTRELFSAGAMFEEYGQSDAQIKSELNKLMSLIQPGDTLMVTEVIHLTLSIKQLCAFIERVKKLHIRLELLSSVMIDRSSGTIDPMTTVFCRWRACFRSLSMA